MYVHIIRSGTWNCEETVVEGANLIKEMLMKTFSCRLSIGKLPVRVGVWIPFVCVCIFSCACALFFFQSFLVISCVLANACVCVLYICIFK